MNRSTLYHWKRDPHDARDFYLNTSKANLFSLVPAVPPSVDLSPFCSVVEDQGNLGSCTGNALVGALELLERKNAPNSTPLDLSRLFVYYNERALEGTVSQDAGAMISDGIKTLAAQGVCSEKTWPYRIQRFASKPSTKAYKEGLGHRINQYARVSRTDGMNDIRLALASGYPIVFGFVVYPGFESDKVASTGTLNLPTAAEKKAGPLGGHAVLAVGYNDSTKRVLVRNSWGSSWGKGGYFTMPYAYITDRNLASDLWTITQ